MQRMQVFPLPKKMMMKKIVKRVLAAAMAVCMMAPMAGISVCAAALETTKNTTVSYTVSDSYEWSVPSNLTLVDGAAELTVEASSCVISTGKKLSITAVGNGTDGAFTVALGGGQTLGYTITVGNSADSLAVNGEVLAVNAGTTAGSAILKFKLAEDAAATMAGTYTGTVTYTASVVAQNP